MLEEKIGRINMNKYYIKNSWDVIYDKKSNPGYVDLVVVGKECSDGFHTFDELYEHRCALFCVLLKNLRRDYSCWKSKKHSDGSIPFNNLEYFICGIETRDGQITYHMKIDPWWNRLEDTFEYEIAPPYDGHTSKDVIERLLKL